MKKTAGWKKFLHYLPLVVFGWAITLSGCGGGGQGEASSGSTLTPGSAGSVAILLTDGPTSEFSEVNVTIQRIELLSDTGKVTIYSSATGKVVNLLQLENEAQLFNLAENVPEGRYEKIRLDVSQVELVKPDQTSVLAELPANGKIDLNPRKPFFVVAGQTLLIQLDMDAAKAIHVVSTGKGNKYQFRPVVFVEILREEVPGKLVRLSGRVEQLQETSFLLCPPLQVQPLIDDPNSTDRCIAVNVGADTSFFDAAGDPVAFEALQENDSVQVIGRFQVGGLYCSNGDAPVPQFAAILVEIGAFLRLDGTVLAAPEGTDSTQSFQFQVAPGQGLAGDLIVDTVLFNEATKIFSSDGTPLDPTALIPGKEVTIDGVLVIPDGQVQPILKAALIIVKGSEALSERQGSIAQIDLDQDVLQVSMDDQSQICASIAGAELFRMTTTSVVDVQLISLPTELMVGDRVILFGMEGASCFEVKYLFVID